MQHGSLRQHALAVAGYVCLSVLFTWPLVLYLGTRLPGSPGGDTGVYVWNLWVFRHEILAGHFPFFTNTIFSLDWAANLSLHNYTVFADLLAFPLLPLAGVVRTFNLLHMGLFVLNAWAMFALARRLTGHPSIAWIAGVLFGFSPTLVARSMAHASLLAAAPLPFFALCLINLGAAGSRRWAIAAGATLAWATLCDPYYGIYCVLLAGWHVASCIVEMTVEHRERATVLRAALPLEAAIGALVALVVVIVASGGFSLNAGAVVVGLQTIYTPVLLLTVAIGARLLVGHRPHLSVRPASEWMGLLKVAPHAVATSVVLLSPMLYAFALRVIQGRYVEPPVRWRTSMPGVDLLSLVGPNPNLAWLNGWREWLAGRSGGFEENVASVTFSALVVLAVAFASARFRPSRYWAGLAGLAATMTLGPFVHVAGANTCIPTPWTLLRYAPLVGAARAPARFAAVVVLAVSVLVALALKALVERYPGRRRQVLGIVGAALLLELCPAPRPLHSAAVPAIYERIAADPRNVRVLELPFGVRDGLSSFGNFSASTQYYQTSHGKRLIGGYLSRVSGHRVRAIRRRPILAALMVLSEGKPIGAADIDSLMALAPRFVERTHLGYVVIDRSSASQALVDFAIRVLSLEKIDGSGTRELYRPKVAEVPGPQAAASWQAGP